MHVRENYFSFNVVVVYFRETNVRNAIIISFHAIAQMSLRDVKSEKEK